MTDDQSARGNSGITLVCEPTKSAMQAQAQIQSMAINGLDRQREPTPSAVPRRSPREVVQWYAEQKRQLERFCPPCARPVE
ncbi:MAG: hypothetical protein M1830_009384 [Pleopsidium flavum]|nr:MAG: hypothetical protein M1830_009384 [Pleopsidium flavum]